MIGRTAVMLLVVMAWAGQTQAAPTIHLQSAPSGVSLAGSLNAVTMNLGNGNGLAVGTPAIGVVLASLASGPVYSSAFTVSLTGWGGGASISVTAYVSANFVHAGGASPLVAVMHCQAADCTVAANQQQLSTSSASPTAIRSGVADKTNFTSNVGALIGYVNGGSAFTGPDSATITFTAVDTANTGHSDTVTLTVSTTVQQAVQFSLATAGGLPVSAGGSTDYLVDFGTVDGLGVSSGNGTTVSVTPAGARYSSPYLARPAFSSMTSTTGTVRMYVSGNFAHTNLLQLQDSATGAANTFGAISTSATPAQQTVISTSAQSKVSITRYLGLFVFNINGPGAFTGADSAVITYTLIVP